VLVLVDRSFSEPRMTFPFGVTSGIWRDATLVEDATQGALTPARNDVNVA
jgi:hypothetical protein